MPEEEGGLSGLTDRLDRIANLMALTLVRDLDRDEQIRLLAAVGYKPTQIGAFLDEKPNTISQAIKRQKERKAHPRKAGTSAGKK